MILRWLCTLGDAIFGVGALALVWFIYGLQGGWSVRKPAPSPMPEKEKLSAPVEV